MRGFSIVRWRTNQGFSWYTYYDSHLADVPFLFLRGPRSRKICHWGSWQFDSGPHPSPSGGLLTAAGLIAFNKSLMNAERFPYAKSDDCDLDLLMFDFPNGKSTTMGNLLGLCCLLLFGGSLSKKTRRCTCSWPLFCHSCSTLSHLRCTQAWIKPGKTGERILGAWPLGIYPEGGIQKGGMGQYLCELQAQTPHFA